MDVEYFFQRPGNLAGPVHGAIVLAVRNLGEGITAALQRRHILRQPVGGIIKNTVDGVYELLEAQVIIDPQYVGCFHLRQQPSQPFMQVIQVRLG